VPDCQAAQAPHAEEEVRARWVDFDDAELTALRDAAARAAKLVGEGTLDRSTVMEHLNEIAAIKDLRHIYGDEPVQAALRAGLEAAEQGLIAPGRNGMDWRTLTLTARALGDTTFAPVQFILPGFVPEGVTILAGKSRVGKSALALDLCLAVVGGGRTLGGLTPAQGDALYLALEDSPRRLRRRLDRLSPAGTPWPERLTLVTQWRGLAEGGLGDIAAWCSAAPAPRLVVIDTLAKARRPMKGRNVQEINDATLGRLHRLAMARGVAVVAIHHTRKREADDILDGVGAAGAADTILVLARSGDGAVLHARGRDIEDSDTAMQFDKAAGQWTMLGPAADVHRSDERGRILAVLAGTDGESLPVTYIMDAAGLRSRNAADVMLGRMVAAGDIARAGRGRYALPDDCGKIGQIDRNDAHPADGAAETRNLSNLSDLSGLSDTRATVGVG
jgi:AAA domain